MYMLPVQGDQAEGRNCSPAGVEFYSKNPTPPRSRPRDLIGLCRQHAKPPPPNSHGRARRTRKPNRRKGAARACVISSSQYLPRSVTGSQLGRTGGGRVGSQRHVALRQQKGRCRSRRTAGSGCCRATAAGAGARSASSCADSPLA